MGSFKFGNNCPVYWHLGSGCVVVGGVDGVEDVFGVVGDVVVICVVVVEVDDVFDEVVSIVAVIGGDGDVNWVIGVEWDVNVVDVVGVPGVVPLGHR